MIIIQVDVQIVGAFKQLPTGVTYQALGAAVVRQRPVRCVFRMRLKYTQAGAFVELAIRGLDRDHPGSAVAVLVHVELVESVEGLPTGGAAVVSDAPVFFSHVLGERLGCV